MRDPLGVSHGNVNNSNSCISTKDSLLNIHACLRDLRIETFKGGPEGPNRRGKKISWGQGWSSAAAPPGVVPLRSLDAVSRGVLAKQFLTC